MNKHIDLNQKSYDTMICVSSRIGLSSVKLSLRAKPFKGNGEVTFVIETGNSEKEYKPSDIDKVEKEFNKLLNEKSSVTKSNKKS